MRLTLLSGPAVEPLVLDDVKAHLRIDGDDEDAYLATLVRTSREHIEAALGLALVTQTWRGTLDSWPAEGTVALTLRPLQRVSQIVVRDAQDAPTIIAASDYDVDMTGGRIAPIASVWPVPGKRFGGIEITFVAGFGDHADDVPEPIRQALRLLVAHWYEVRNPVHIGSSASRVPDTVSELLMPYRAVRI